MRNAHLVPTHLDNLFYTVTFVIQIPKSLTTLHFRFQDPWIPLAIRIPKLPRILATFLVPAFFFISLLSSYQYLFPISKFSKRP